MLMRCCCAVGVHVQEEGVLGLWKGVGPTCGRATVLAAAELATCECRMMCPHAAGGSLHDAASTHSTSWSAAWQLVCTATLQTTR